MKRKGPFEAMNRWGDWLEQSFRDLRHAEHARDDHDFHVLTREEVERFRRQGSPLLRIAIKTGRELLE